MDVAIEQRWENFVESVVRDGHYASASAVVDEGLRLLAEKERKLADLRATIDASIARGGSNTAEEVMAYLREALEHRREQRKRA